LPFCFFFLQPLRRVLARKKLQFVFESFDKQNPTQLPILLSPQMLGYLKKIRFQAKAELDRWPPMQDKPPPLIHLLPLFVFFIFIFLSYLFLFYSIKDVLIFYSIKHHHQV